MSRPPRKTTTYDRIYAAIRRIPRGRVATYAQIAVVAGFPGQPRLVGYALNALGENDTAPWHRVLNIKGEISPRAEAWAVEAQRSLLEEEGITFELDGCVSLRRFQWRPRGPRGAAYGSTGGVRSPRR